MSALIAVSLVLAMFVVLSALAAVAALVAEWLEDQPEPRKTTWARIDDELAHRRALRSVQGTPLGRPSRETRRDAYAEFQR